MNCILEVILLVQTLVKADIPGGKEWKCCMFGSTAEDENNCIGEFFALYGRKFLTIETCST